MTERRWAACKWLALAHRCCFLVCGCLSAGLCSVLSVYILFCGPSASCMCRVHQLASQEQLPGDVSDCFLGSHAGSEQRCPAWQTCASCCLVHSSGSALATLWSLEVLLSKVQSLTQLRAGQQCISTGHLNRASQHAGKLQLAADMSAASDVHRYN